MEMLDPKMKKKKKRKLEKTRASNSNTKKTTNETQIQYKHFVILDYFIIIIKIDEPNPMSNFSESFSRNFIPLIMESHLLNNNSTEEEEEKEKHKQEN